MKPTGREVLRKRIMQFGGSEFRSRDVGAGVANVKLLLAKMVRDGEVTAREESYWKGTRNVYRATDKLLIAPEDRVTDPFAAWRDVWPEMFQAPALVGKRQVYSIEVR